ncbi:MAG: undecaprenyldiphospho-muramoylpentapeptide beta-N-acetylglucosaminyltransferase, partial [Pseudomonadales bacterium]
HFQTVGWEVHYVGSRSGMEQALVAPLGISFHAIPTGKLRRYLSLENLLDVFRVFAGIWSALWLCRRLRPRVVFSKGGYVSFPFVVGAWFNRVPVVAHESDLTPGLANRLAYPFVRRICVTFEQTRQHLRSARSAYTGTPVREELLNGDRAAGRRFLGFDDQRPILLVVGGSLGALRLNEVVRAGLSGLTDRFQVVHIAGAGNLDAAHDEVPSYRQFEYLVETYADVLAASDVVVSRAGANSVYELVVLAKPHLLVPLPLSASRGDQIENAEYTSGRGLSDVILDEELTPESLNEALQRLLQHLDERRVKLQEFETLDSVRLITDLLESEAR